jgi:hypothetical protein
VISKSTHRLLQEGGNSFPQDTELI